MSVIMANVFLGCFLVGFILTLVTFLFGTGSGNGHFHLGHHGHIGGHGHSGIAPGSGQLPYFNFSSLVMFLTLFGGMGMILNHETNGAVVVCLFGASLVGIIGAFVIFLFVNKVLIKGNTVMDPTEYHMPGTLGRVSVPIREGGTGEIVYVQGGSRKCAAARMEDGVACPRGEEVVIVSYDKGIAYVKSVGDELGAGTGSE